MGSKKHIRIEEIVERVPTLTKSLPLKREQGQWGLLKAGQGRIEGVGEDILTITDGFSFFPRAALILRMRGGGEG